MNNTGTIYLLQFPNGKTYVGQTWNFNRRMSQHKKDKKCVVNKAIHKYGWENIDVEILKDNLQTQEEMDISEAYYMNLYCSRITQNGYNIKEAGSNGKHSEESKKKMKDRIFSIEHRKKISDAIRTRTIHPMTGKTHSEETKIRMSKAQKGRTFSPETIRKMSGKKHTEEQRKANSERQQGEKSAWWGKHHTEESKRLMSEKKKQYWKNKNV